MDINWKALASLVLVSAFTVASAQTTATARKTHKATAKGPSVESQIEELRQEMEAQRSQIDSLKQQLSERDTALQQAQQAAASAQTAAQQAQAAAQSQQQALDASNQTVNSLQGAVADLKTSTATIQSDQKKLVGQVEHPDEIHYKGITFSPHGSFIEAATVYRSAATGGGINTPFTGIPLDNANGAQLSEFYGSGRQSRLALKATGKLDSMKMTGYYEMDWLGTGITSNNNQSNSYVLRQRQLWAQAALNNGWTFTGGQMWSLATETTHGLDNGTEILPATIDPQYEAGFVWTRQYGFRVTKDFGNKFWVGASAENAETLNPAGSSLPTNLLLGSAGVGGGLYDSASNYSFNIAPDMIAKVAWEPGWGHYEVFGIARFFRDRIYPAGTTSVGAYNDTTTGGGIGASGRVPLFQNKLSLGLKGLYGMGVGRYGDSQIADITLRPDAQIAPLRGFSALSTLEANPTKRLMLYTNYGGDYIYRRYFGKVGYGSPLTNMSGCNTEPIPSASFTPNAPANCGGNNKDVQEFTVGEWYNFYDGPKGRLRLGLQYSYFWRVLWSGAGGTANPGGGAQGNDNVFETSFRYYVP